MLTSRYKYISYIDIQVIMHASSQFGVMGERLSEGFPDNFLISFIKPEVSFNNGGTI